MIDKTGDIWQKKKWIIAAGMFLLLEVFVIINIVIPTVSSIFEIHNMLDLRKQKIASVSNWESEMINLRKAKSRIDDSLSDLLLKVPESDRISILTRFLNETAGSAGISISSIQPLTHITGGQQITIPIQLKAAGDYEGLGTFINGLEEARFVIKVDQSSLFKEGLDDENIQADLFLNWIVLKENIEM